MPLFAAFPTLHCHEGSEDTPPSTDNNRQAPRTGWRKGGRRRKPADETAASGHCSSIRAASSDAAVIVRPSTLLKLHDLLRQRNYRLPYSSGCIAKPGRIPAVLKRASRADFARRQHAIRNHGRNHQPPCRPQSIPVEISLPRVIPVTRSHLKNNSSYTRHQT